MTGLIKCIKDHSVALQDSLYYMDIEEGSIWWASDTADDDFGFVTNVKDGREFDPSSFEAGILDPRFWACAPHAIDDDYRWINEPMTARFDSLCGHTYYVKTVAGEVHRVFNQEGRILIDGDTYKHISVPWTDIVAFIPAPIEPKNYAYKLRFKEELNCYVKDYGNGTVSFSHINSYTIP